MSESTPTTTPFSTTAAPSTSSSTTPSSTTAASTTSSTTGTITASVSTRQSTSTVSPVVSTYSNSLSMASPIFQRPNGLASGSYYYQAIQVTSATSATYTLRSSSTLDTYGCFYQGSFDPSNPNRNLILCDDDSGGAGQFSITQYLYWSTSYVLVVTTYNALVTGSYSVLAAGPSTVSMTSIYPSTYPSTTTMRPATTTSATTDYSGGLSSTSPTFSRPGASDNNYYYEAIRMYTYTGGSFSLRSYSTIDTYGCLYLSSFDPLFPNGNRVTCDDDSGGDRQFLINSNLQVGSTYILVVTTYTAGVTGSYRISAAGPGSVYMTSITPVQTTYRGSLSSSDPTFTRYGGYSSGYYYNSIEVTTNTSDSYIFRSSSTSSTDLYGCLYSASFDPSYPSLNQIACDDDSAGSGQFRLTSTLSSFGTYILVVTTFSSYVTGSYSIAVTGPVSVSMRSTTPNPPPLTLIQIVAISIGCVVFFAVIAVIVCVCRRKQRTPANRQCIVGRPNAARNAPYVRQVNVVGGSTPTARPPGYPVIVEEAPPSYQAYVSNARP